MEVTILQPRISVRQITENCFAVAEKLLRHFCDAIFFRCTRCFGPFPASLFPSASLIRLRVDTGSFLFLLFYVFNVKHILLQSLTFRVAVFLFGRLSFRKSPKYQTTRRVGVRLMIVCVTLACGDNDIMT